MKNAIWLFAGGAMQELAVKKILDRGFKLILTDKNPLCVCSKYASELVPLDTFDIQGNIKAAKKIRLKYNINAVLTLAADCHETVANVAQTLRLPGLNPGISNICRYKFRTREFLRKAGIAQPKFMKVSNLSETIKALETLELPVAIKSTDNSGSRGFTKIDTIEDLTEEVIDKAIIMGTTGYAIIEELLQPLEKEISEQSVETLWCDGKMYWLNWVDRLFRKDLLLFENFKTNTYFNIPWGIEIGHINPAIHNEYIRGVIYNNIYQAGIAIGMGKQKGAHILKADIMVTKYGPYILELTPRLSGGWDSSRTTPRRGADFVGGAISIALGEKLDLDLWMKYFCYLNPNLFSSVLTLIDDKAIDCIGRKFAEGYDFEREKSLIKAYENINGAIFVTSDN